MAKKKNDELSIGAEFTDSERHSFGVRIIMDLFDVSPVVAFVSLTATGLIVAFAVFYFLNSAPPTTLTISSGQQGSMFQKNALKYKEYLEKNGIKVNVITSEGSMQNLQRLVDPKSHVELGIAQGGLNVPGMEDLETLGSISYQPLFLFYRGDPIELISELYGKKIVVGMKGSGTRKFAEQILEANNIIEEGTSTKFVDLEGEDAAKALFEAQVDAAFIMSESSSGDLLKKLLHSQFVRLYSYKQANAYARKIDHLNILDLPEGGIDFAQDVPAHDVQLLGPMVEIVAKKNLHPALIDLILEAATSVHNHPGLFQKRGDFPAPIEHAIHLSDDATRFHKSGKSWLYRIMPFWLASLLTRITVVFLPMLLFLIPALKSVPAFFRWRAQMRIRRHYRALLDIERRFFGTNDRSQQDRLRSDFERVVRSVNKMKVRPAFADQFYGLRGHMDYVESIMAKLGGRAG